MSSAIPSAISFEAIRSYAEVFGPHDLDDFQRFVILIYAMDGAYIAHQISVINKQSKKGK